MQIGILGAGHMGRTLAAVLVRSGHTVRLANSRGPASLADLVADLGPAAGAATPAEVVAGSDIVILATRWGQIADAVRDLGPWDGRIVVDTTNNRFGPNPGDVYDLGDQTASEVVAALMPGARLVKAFNHQPIDALAGLPGPHAEVAPDERKALFVAGDDGEAKARVAQMIRAMGGAPIDTGTLREGGRLQASGGGPLAGRGRLLSVAEARPILAEHGLADRAVAQ